MFTMLKVRGVCAKAIGLYMGLQQESSQRVSHPHCYPPNIAEPLSSYYTSLMLINRWDVLCMDSALDRTAIDNCC